MPTLASEQLKEQITSLPDDLRKALEQRAKAQINVSHIESQIRKLQSEIEREDSQDDSNSPDYGLEDNLELLKLESAVDRLKLQLAEAEDKAEIDFRKSTEKTTEGQVKAALGTNPDVIKLRHKILDAKDAAKERKITLQSERIKAREARFDVLSAAKKDTTPVNENLAGLQENLQTAKDELILANIEVEIMHAKIETYRMLVKLEDRA